MAGVSWALAIECGVQPQPLIRVLRALAAFGVFTVAPDGSVAHTPRSRLLRTDTPNTGTTPHDSGPRRDHGPPGGCWTWR